MNHKVLAFRKAADACCVYYVRIYEVTKRCRQAGCDRGGGRGGGGSSVRAKCSLECRKSRHVSRARQRGEMRALIIRRPSAAASRKGRMRNEWDLISRKPNVLRSRVRCWLRRSADARWLLPRQANRRRGIIFHLSKVEAAGVVGRQLRQRQLHASLLINT